MENNLINVAQLVQEAERRTRPMLRRTLLEYSYYYSELSGVEVYFKCENMQHTGSFKARGAMNKLLSLSDLERKCGVVTASTGNHGAAVAFGLRHVNTHGIVFVPDNADQSKVENIKRLGAEVRYHDIDSAKTEVFARQYAADQHMIYISPYNDPEIIGGQGTIAVELFEQLEKIDVVFVSLGGGGLISGIAGYLKSIIPHVEIVGCSPENSQVMIQSVRAGTILDLPSKPTLSDGTAGGVELDSITFPLCASLVDYFVTVSEDDIIASMREFIANQHMLIEGSAAVAIAAFKQSSFRYKGKNAVILLCGANISLSKLKDVL